MQARFVQDGAYFPPEAEEPIISYWEAQVGSHREENLPLLGPTYLEQFIPPEPEINQIQPEFFEREEITAAGEVTPERLEQPSGFRARLGSFGRAFKRILGF